jgi:Ca2+-binding RTX toxin-like protein
VGVVTLDLFTDRQTELVTDGRLTYVGEVDGTFKYQLTFTASNWSAWYEVKVVANESFVGSARSLKSFAPAAQNLDQIQGPLIIEGGALEGRDRSFAAALMLPGETDVSVSHDTGADPTGDIDRLDIFHADNEDAESGALVSRANPLNALDPVSWTALTGFETDRLGPSLTVNEGTESQPVYVSYPRGITFDGFEIVEVLLGKGNETLAVSATPNDAITVVHGGGGDDHVTITDRGNGPLVVYGDTSEQRDRYDNDTGFASADATSFTNDGDDTLDASAMAEQGDGHVGVVLYGGYGHDVIYGSQDDDHLAGGTGDDTIGAQGGNDHVYGDSHFYVDPLLFAQDRVAAFAAGDPRVASMFAVRDITRGDDRFFGTPEFIEGAGADSIEGGEGADVVYGDHGTIDLAVGTRRLATTGFVERLSTTQPTFGMADTIYGHAAAVLGSDDDADIVFGGQAGDTIDAGHGDNLVLGDHGVVSYVASDSDRSDIDQIYSTEVNAYGGADTVTTGSGNDIVIGGRFGDTIVSSGGNNLVIGDSGVILAADADTNRSGSLPGTLLSIRSIETLDASEGGADTISLGAGSDVVLAGQAGDTVNAGNGDNVVLGDHGRIDYGADGGDIDRIASLDTASHGGADVLTSGSGNDIVIGGRFGDTIVGGGGDNVVLGDSAEIVAAAADAPRRGGAPYTLITLGSVTTIAPADGGADDITTGAGNDIVLGGQAGDTLASGAGADIVLGDNGRLVLDLDGLPGTLDLVTTADPTLGGADTIFAGSGNDFVFGGTAGDVLYGDRVSATVAAPRGTDMSADSDLIFGDHGELRGIVVASGIGVANPSFAYTAIDTADVDGGGADVIYAGSGPTTLFPASMQTDFARNIILGQQGADSIFGGNGDDDIYGGHNVPGGFDTGDFIDGGAGADVILGDNGSIRRTGSSFDPRFRLSSGPLYDANGDAVVGAEASNPGAVERRIVLLFDHDDNVGGVHDDFFGNDTIAGGADDDVVFGQLGDDRLHGDGLLSGIGGTLVTLTATAALSDVGGDDYLEGNGGTDTVYGGLGQDDIIGGSSSLFGLGSESQRPDAGDFLYGGNGDLIGRSNDGTGVTDETGQLALAEAARHARDADVILGDNANIYRLVANNALLRFGYDNYDARGIVVRAARLLDYTPGGPQYSAAALLDNGAADTIRGEAGDDAIYGMVGDDILFGDAQSDDLIGGYGNDWISGGTDNDGVLGDDGRIYTSRNGTAEPLYGIGAGVVNQLITTPGGVQQAVINVAGELKKTVNLTPFSVDAGWDGGADEFAGVAVAHLSDDIIYGGLGGDWLHGGSGDDAISGAEALPVFYANPANPGNALDYDPSTGEFEAYDEFEPRLLIAGFLLNFDASEGPARVDGTWGTVYDDGNDRLFGDNGNDWLVGGTGRDNLYGGWGDDLLNVDDDHGTHGGLNDAPDTHPTYEDRAYGGAGRDRLIANTGGDRLIDWAGEFNSYIVPFAPFGLGTVSRTLQPQLADFLYALSASDGADPTRAADTGADPLRNGEPEGELGLVRQQDFAWHAQTGAPDDPQPGNIPGGPRDVLRSANFNNTNQASGFFADSGTWEIAAGKLQVSASSLHSDAVSVYHVEDAIPGYFELRATVEIVKPTGGWDANAYMIFDYISPTDFKFVGLDEKINKLVIGHRDASGWHIDKQGSVQGGVKSGKAYNMLVAVNGLNVVLVVDNQTIFTHTFAPRVIDGYSYGLNYGLVGMGSNNSRGTFDNVAVQILPPQLTLQAVDDFAGSPELSFDVLAGSWNVNNSRYATTTTTGVAMSVIDLGIEHLNVNSYLELKAKVNLNGAGRAGFVFDRYEESFKFVAIDAVADRLIIGHYTAAKGWVDDVVVSRVINSGQDYTLGVVLKGSTVSVTLDGQTLLGYVYNATTVDGAFGVIAIGGAANFDDVAVKTDDRAFAAPAQGLAASTAAAVQAEVSALDGATLAPVVEAAIRRLSAAFGLDAIQRAALADADFSVVDLPGPLLGRHNGGVIEIDLDAAGHGWFIDATPDDDREFDKDGGAPLGSAAAGHIDLLTVVMHELGHLLALDHDSLPFMADSLDLGVRLPIETASAVSTGNSGGHTPIRRSVADLWSPASVVNRDDGLFRWASTSAAMAVPAGAPPAHEATLGRVQFVPRPHTPLFDFAHRFRHTR